MTRPTDKSPKGEIDPLIVPFMDIINKSQHYETTSSCSGRISVFVEKEGKKVGRWIFVSHQKVKLHQNFITTKEFESYEITNSSCLFGGLNIKLGCHPSDQIYNEMPRVYFKFEPFILHVSTDSVKNGQRFMQVCLEAGYAYTGLVVTQKRTMIQIKSPLKLDAPIGYYDSLTNTIHLVVDAEYINWLIEISNRKFDQNEARMQRLLNSLTDFLE
jgi:tRNA wybutosine-synthesizing protein 3